MFMEMGFVLFFVVQFLESVLQLYVAGQGYFVVGIFAIECVGEVGLIAVSDGDAIFVDACGLTEYLLFVC